MAKRSSQPEPDRFDLAGSPARGQERIAQLADKLGRVYGKTTMLPLSSAFHTRVKRLPFGILLLDWKARGLVINRINRIWGRRSTLKTTLCLRVMRQAQHHCRHCKTPLVIRPADGRRDCACPSPRWWLLDAAEDYAWLPHRAALEIAEGRLPEGAVEKTLKGTGTKRPALRCEPPPGVKGEARDIFFTEMERCEPWRCLYIDSEQTLDDAWIRANGVDPSLVSTIGSRWGEQVYASIEEAILTREFDLVVIDSTSVLEARVNLEKSYEENPKTAAKAQLGARFARRYLAAAADEGLLARYRPTVLTTSQITTAGIGGGGHAYQTTTDGNAFDHALSLDIKMTEAGYTFDDSKTFALVGDYGFEVKKDKAGGNVGASGVISFWLRPTAEHGVGDSEDMSVVLDYSRRWGEGFVLEGSGKSKLTLYSPYVENQQQEFSRIGDCIMFLREHPTIYDELRSRVLARLIASNEVPPKKEKKDEKKKGDE